MKNVVREANKIKEQQKKKIGQLNKKHNFFSDWLKAAGYLDTEDQDAIQYIFNPPKNNVNNENKPTEPAETAGDVTDLKKASGMTAAQLAAKKLVKK